MHDPVARALEEDLFEEDYKGGGEFLHHYGDAPAWAGVLLARRWHDREVSAREQATLDAVLDRIRRLVTLGARSRPEWEEAGLGLLALMAAFEVAPDRADAWRIGTALTLADTAAAVQGGLVRGAVGAHGPATITAALAYGNLRWADALGSRGDRYRRSGELLLRRLRNFHRDRETGLYRDQPSRRAEAFPNLTVAAALARSGRPAEARELLEAAAKVLAAPGGAWALADAGDDAAPLFLSVQNHVAFAWREVARATEARADLREAAQSIEWSFEHLLHDGRLRHHLEADANVSPRYCTGCNLQALALREDLADRGAFD